MAEIVFPMGGLLDVLPFEGVATTTARDPVSKISLNPWQIDECLPTAFFANSCYEIHGDGNGVCPVDW